MVIYGEYLFLENFITGIVITHFTGKIAGYPTSAVRLILCGIFSGAYAFTLFTGISGIASAALKVVFLLCISLLAFGEHPRRKRIFRGAVCFLLVTFFYGGIAISILSMMNWKGITAAGGVYMDAASYLSVTISGSAGALIIEIAVRQIKTMRKEMKISLDVTLYLEEYSWTAKGLIDSGNFLKDPLSGKPVAVVSEKFFRIIKETSGDNIKRYAVIPYSSVGVTKGILEGYRIDALKADGICIKNPVLAVWGDTEEQTGENQILLPEALIERGIYADMD